VFAGCVSVAASAQQYDLVINNGRVMDPETGLDAIRNVAVQDKKIVAVSTGVMQGKTVIDATGLVVAPGFIDLHSHGQDAEREGKALINYGASSGHIPAVMNVLHDIGTFLPRDHAITDTPTPVQPSRRRQLPTSNRDCARAG
jgi:hypothetical protein